MHLSIEEILKECPEWFHSIELAPNAITPGRKSAETLKRELRLLRLPDLRDKSVLDVGAYDGFFSFAAERLGAARVVALDHYVWSVDMAAYMADWRESKRSGIPPPIPHESRHWRPTELPGRKPFDLARRALGSKVEPVVGDFMTMDLESLGQFDVVLFLGVLYHMENPLAAARRLYKVTAPGGVAVIETEAIEIPGLGGRPCCEFFPGSEMNNDASNWWVPNAKAVEGLCRAAGFQGVSVYRGSGGRMVGRQLGRSLVSFVRECLKGRVGIPVLRYRAFAHARHSGTFQPK
jgi:tRNA (mo5U34)-methyltransferase